MIAIHSSKARSYLPTRFELEYYYGNKRPLQSKWMNISGADIPQMSRAYLLRFFLQIRAVASDLVCDFAIAIKKKEL